MSESPTSVIFDPSTLRQSHYAPELVELIRQGVLNADLSVADGYIEFANGSLRRYLTAFTLNDLQHAYRSSPEAAVHSLDISGSTVLDSARMDYLRLEYANDRDKSILYEKFHGEWQTVVRMLLGDEQS